MKHLLVILIFITGCSTLDNQTRTEALGTGAVGGAAIGATSGAIVGAVIANGDVAMSAALGGGVGLVAGATLAYAYKANQENRAVEANNDEIRSNYNVISGNQSYIDAYRKKVLSDSSEITPTSDVNHQYMGNTIGIN